MHYETDWRQAHDKQEPELAGDSFVELLGTAGMALIAVLLIVEGKRYPILRQIRVVMQ